VTLRTSVVRALAVVVTTCATLALDAADSIPLSVEFEQQAVRVTGVAMSPITILVISRDYVDNRWKVTERLESLTDTDRDGAVRLQLDNPVSTFTFCAAVDEGDGRYATNGAAFTPAPIPNDGAPLKKNEAGNILRAEFSAPFVDALVVRPGKGRWYGSIGEGGPEDDDGRLNHKLVIGFPRLKDKDGLKGPDHLLPKDILIVTDPHHMRVAAFRVGEKE
jgi:hypothetical protein